MDDGVTGLGSYAVLVIFLIGLPSFLVFRSLDKLSDYPGPRLAKLTKAYRFYYDVVESGGLLDQLQRLHVKFGKLL
jgi:hypothetical protein